MGGLTALHGLVVGAVATSAVDGVIGGTASAVTVVGAAAGATAAVFGVATAGFGLSKIADSFRSDGKKRMDIPSTAQGGIAKGIAKKLGASEKTANKVEAGTDLVTGGVPKDAKALIETGSNIIKLIGDHSGKVNKSGMQRDHTKTPAVKPKPVSKPKPKTTIQSES